MFHRGSVLENIHIQKQDMLARAPSGPLKMYQYIFGSKVRRSIETVQNVPVHFGSQSPVETAQNISVHLGSKVRRPIEDAQNVPVHFGS